MYVLISSLQEPGQQERRQAYRGGKRQWRPRSVCAIGLCRPPSNWPGKDGGWWLAPSKLRWSGILVKVSSEVQHDQELRTIEGNSIKKWACFVFYLLRRK